MGRGCLAGPVVAGAVILPAGCVLPGLDDSKRVDADARARLAAQIRRRAVAVGIGVVEARQIDADNILRASLEAMRRAVCALDPPPDVLLVDAVRVPGVRMPQLPVVHGDALSLSIAAGVDRRQGPSRPPPRRARAPPSRLRFRSSTRATERPSTGKRCVSTGRVRSTA